jgi:hypothetical protein
MIDEYQALVLAYPRRASWASGQWDSMPTAGCVEGLLRGRFAAGARRPHALTCPPAVNVAGLQRP